MSITPWSPTTTILASVGETTFRSSSTQLVNGTILVAYISYSGGLANEMAFQRYSDAGVAIGSPVKTGFQVTFTGGNNQEAPDVTSLSDGGFAVVFQSGTDVVAQKYTSAGIANGSLITVATNSQNSDVDALPSGQFVVAHDQKFTVVQSNGTPLGTVDLGVSTTDSDVAVSAGRIGIIRDSDSTTVSISTYDLNGFLFVAGSTGSTSTGTIGDNAIASLSNGSFVGVFEKPSSAGAGRSIHAIMTNTDGTPLNNGVLLVDNLNDVVGLDIQELSSGGFAIVYSAYSGTGGGSAFGYETYVKMFNADGSTNGPQFTIEKTDPSLYNELPELTSLYDGRLLVTWTHKNVGFTLSDVKMQILDPRDGYYVGTAGIDKIYGHDGRVDEIHGQAGNDTIYGLAGADTLYGESGTDFLYGGRGDDTTRGGADNDYIYGDLGDDEQFGEGGNDLMYSGRGADLLDGGVGSDTAYYTSEKIGAVINLLNQLLNAGSADGDTFVAVERFFGSELGADNITGDNVSNTILGNGGADIINGAGGADVLRGGVGADTINGGTESDLFQYTALNEVGDSIVNFEAIDNFQFTRAAFGNLAGANVAAINFLSAASGHVATTAAHRFIFDQAVDQLWYDADGNAAGAAVMVADLTNNINITNLDLLLM